MVERCAGWMCIATAGGHGAGSRQAPRHTPGRDAHVRDDDRGLGAMADWLLGEHAVTLVGMEATGVYVRHEGA